jgi:hypothetical protein
VQKKKTSRVSPCFYILKVLKVPFQATRCSGGVGISIVVIFIVVVVVVADLVSKERGTMQKAKS